MKNMGSNKEQKQMLEGDADDSVGQPPLFALGPGWVSRQFVSCRCLGETNISNFLPESEDLTFPRQQTRLPSKSQRGINEEPWGG